MNVSQHSVIQAVDKEKIFQWIIELSNPETRENALLELRFVIRSAVFVTGVPGAVEG